MSGRTKKLPNTPRFNVGDVVEYELVGGRRKQGTIIEDRQPLGTGGGRVYRLSVRYDLDNVVEEFELAEDFLSPVRRAS